MPESLDLASKIKNSLPVEAVSFMGLAGGAAAETGQRIYLVGGAVRDLILGQPSFDLDLVVEGDAISLAKRLALTTQAKATYHAAFNTAKLRWDRWSVDLATVRSETYSRPGALPSVKAGTLETDLFRRDFTINAMAVELTAGRYGKLIDLYGGLADLRKGLVRVLHDGSFKDDATRIWRAVRYEQRLDFRLERRTKRLLSRDVPMLDTISGDRIRHELEFVLKEARPEKALHRAYELGVLAKLHASLKGDGWLARKFRQARDMKGEGPLTALYLILLVYRLQPDETRHLISFLRLPKPTAQVLQDNATLSGRLARLAEPRLRPSQIYNLLKDIRPAAVAAARLASDSPLVRNRVGLYLDRLRYAKTLITGDDLLMIGVRSGPRMRELLQSLLEARLDGKVVTREDEVQTALRLVIPDTGP